MTSLLILSICVLAIAGVIFRPFNIAEHFWAAAGALILLFTGLLTITEGFHGITEASMFIFF